MDQFPQHMTADRPKTAISKRETNAMVFDDNDDAAELLPDWIRTLVFSLLYINYSLSLRLFFSVVCL